MAVGSRLVDMDQPRSMFLDGNKAFMVAANRFGVIGRRTDDGNIATEEIDRID